MPRANSPLQKFAPAATRWRLNQPDDYHSASTDPFGYFSIPSVPPGSYHAFAWRDVDYDNYTGPAFRQPFLPKAQAFSLAEGEKKTLELTLLPGSADAQ